MYRLAAIAATSLLMAACSGDQKPGASADSGGDAGKASGAVTIAVAGLNGDPARGRTLFAQCRSCHVLEEGVNRVGPSLHGIIGRKAGTVDGFNYSEANKASAVTWTEDSLFQYLEGPRAFMPGTKMAYAGMKKPQDRADLIAYLKAEG